VAVGISRIGFQLNSGRGAEKSFPVLLRYFRTFSSMFSSFFVSLFFVSACCVCVCVCVVGERESGGESVNVCVTTLRALVPA